jgi:cytochrome P450
MPSSSLRLRSLMNNPSNLDLSRDWITLDSIDPPTLLVYGNDLAKQVLKANEVASLNIVNYWKLVAQMGNERLPAIEELFDATPLMLHGDAHTSSRKNFMRLYKKAEISLDSWLPNFCKQFFLKIKNNNEKNPIIAVSNFLEELARHIFADNLNCKANEIPKFPDSIFRMLAKKEILQEYDQRLNNIIVYAKELLKKSGRDPDDAWAIASISTMGEPLKGALLYGLANTPPTISGWDAETLLNVSAPVNTLGRRVLKDCKVRDLDLFEGQYIFVCPFLLHLRNDYFRDSVSSAYNSREQTSFAFGFGSHICPGRKMAIKIAGEFLKHLALQPPDFFDLIKIKLIRDFTIIPVNTTQ